MVMKPIEPKRSGNINSSRSITEERSIFAEHPFITAAVAVAMIAIMVVAGGTIWLLAGSGEPAPAVSTEPTVVAPTEPTAKPTPSPEPTVAPTVTPLPTATLNPTATTEATPTPEPTSTPEPEEQPTPVDEDRYAGLLMAHMHASVDDAISILEMLMVAEANRGPYWQENLEGRAEDLARRYRALTDEAALYHQTPGHPFDEFYERYADALRRCAEAYDHLTETGDLEQFRSSFSEAMDYLNPVLHDYADFLGL